MDRAPLGTRGAVPSTPTVTFARRADKLMPGSEPLVRVTLDEEQSRKMRFLARQFHKPPLSGLVRAAIDEWIDHQFTDPEIQSEWLKENPQRRLRIEP